MAACLGPAPPALAARGVQARATLITRDGERQEQELAEIRFVHYRRRLAKWGRWEKPPEGGRRRSTVKLVPLDQRYESRYLLFENGTAGIRLNKICSIRPRYRERGERQELVLAVTDRRGREREVRILDLLDGHQPVEAHFSGKRKGNKHDLPLPPLWNDAGPPADLVLERMVFLRRDCRDHIGG